MDITDQKLSLPKQANCMLKIYALFGDISDATHTKVTCISRFTKTNIDWKKLQYMKYNDFVMDLHCFSTVMDIVAPHQSTQQREIWATKKPEDFWPHNPELQEILTNSRGNEQWIL
jgi:hypothetical protein